MIFARPSARESHPKPRKHGFRRFGGRVRRAPDGAWYTIVGVVGDVRAEALEKPAEETVYFSMRGHVGQFEEVPRAMTLVVRTAGDPRAAAGAALKPSVLELGGSDAFVVLDDADLDHAAGQAALARCLNNGQSCIAAKRFVVVDAVYDAFAEKLAQAVGRMKVGDGLEQGTDLGPLIEPKAADKVKEHIEDAVAKGARVLTGGHGHPLGGQFFEPTIVTAWP